MQDTQLRFHSSNGKRLVLIVEDEPINQEILGSILEDTYELIFAANGKEALEAIQAHFDTLSLVLLDLVLPDIHGMEVLRSVKENPQLARIPIIVMTSDKESEVDSLTIGAIDFIPKPYPMPKVILARIRRTIELSEDRDIIQSTERDPLTGLYNREYFFRYAEQFDQYHPTVEMDAIVMGISHFRMIKERFGTAYGDQVLRQVGEKAREMVQHAGGLLCRLEADTFLIYCPHQENYEALLNHAAIGLDEGDARENRIRLRMGVYSRVDKQIDIERRFDRANIAADTLRASVTKTVAIYDNALHEKELFQERLVEDFHKAIREEQFLVFYQPKFDVRPQIPVLSSAEALVRWAHPELGMISPGIFIPLFEENGLIQELDTYVWQHAAAQIRDWKNRFDFVAPVSVNVSRIDMYDPRLNETFQRILREYGLSPAEFLLEITESAYTQDSQQIIHTVNQLRSLGFRIEMDDFGTGYSSLNMISSLPIDALKLDMQFIRSAFSEHKDTRVLEVIIDIADYLSVPVIAEGVETREQLEALKEMGCDIVQGYYFSKPVPAHEYERFILARAQQADALPQTQLPRAAQRKKRPENGPTLGEIAHALARDYFNIYCVDTQTDHFIAYSAHDDCAALSIDKSGEDFFAFCRSDLARLVYPEDQHEFLTAVEKNALLTALEKAGTFTLTYRLLLGDTPTYVHMKASRMENSRDSNIVIGVSSIDDQVRREQEHERQLAFAREQANRDALTGVKNKHSYLEAEKRWNEDIARAEAEPFAIAVCDINGLKVINDTLGHKAGDQQIRTACSIVCNIFKHSPVYRIGGDEFVAILSGQDYEHRQGLMAQLQEINQDHLQAGKVTIACGMADYRPGRDALFGAVFDRADECMYQNKNMLKGGPA